MVVSDLWSIDCGNSGQLNRVWNGQKGDFERRPRIPMAPLLYRLHSFFNTTRDLLNPLHSKTFGTTRPDP